MFARRAPPGRLSHVSGAPRHRIMARMSVTGTAGTRLGELRATTWHEVQGVIAPLAGRPGAEALYVTGATEFGPAAATGTGRRLRTTVPAHGTASFGTYFNAFPAAHWRHSTRVTRARLRVETDVPATVTVHRSDERGAVRMAGVGAAKPGAPAAIVLDISGHLRGGMLWFTLHAGPDAVTLVGGGWDVDAAPVRVGGLVLGMPTMQRETYVAANLAAIADAPDVLREVADFIVVDHGSTPLIEHPGMAEALELVGAHVVRQRNLGGSGGFSRVLSHASTVPGAAAAVLLDDDIALEPASVLRTAAFGRHTSVPTIVGGQMLDLEHPSVLQSGAEVVDRARFWWGPAAPEHARPDLAEHAIPETRWLHRRLDSDFAGWWMCQIPIEAIERVGLALPLFLKWDDAEYGLRAAAVGIPTVSLPGAAVWHMSWAYKDDMLEWPAFFHARNRMIAALIHGTDPRRLLAASVLLDVKHLLSMQYTTVAIRHAALSAVFDGPDALAATEAVLADARRLASGPDLVRHHPDGVPDGPDAAVDPRRPARAPAGADLAMWFASAVTRHLSAVREGRAPTKLSPGRRRWWVIPAHDSVLAPTADGEAFFWYRRDPHAFRAGLAGSVRLHRRLAREWPALSARYRREAGVISSIRSWAGRFADAAALAARTR